MPLVPWPFAVSHETVGYFTGSPAFRRIIGTCRDTCENSLCHVECPLIFSLTHEVWLDGADFEILPLADA
jgi:hypothetical protein